MTTELWLLVLTAIAAVGGVTGVWLVILAWIDRPQPGWNIHIDRERFREVYNDDGSQDLVPIDFDERHKETLAIKPVGTARMHSVEIRFTGCTVVKASDGMYAPEWMPGSDPREFDVWLPAASEGDANVEIWWLQLRPRRVHGWRLNIRTRRWETWQWRWRSLRLRGWRLRRTTGRWVAKESSYPDIPVEV